MQGITLDIKKRLESYTNLEYLTFNDCGLESLENFPDLPNLIRLELIGNKLTEVSSLGHLSKLQSLWLGGN